MFVLSCRGHWYFKKTTNMPEPTKKDFKCRYCDKTLPRSPMKVGNIKVCGEEDCVRKAIRQELAPNTPLFKS